MLTDCKQRQQSWLSHNSIIKSSKSNHIATAGVETINYKPILCWISGSHNSKKEDESLLEDSAV
jgi:hypothetical protein